MTSNTLLSSVGCLKYLKYSSRSWGVLTEVLFFFAILELNCYEINWLNSKIANKIIIWYLALPKNVFVNMSTP